MKLHPYIRKLLEHEITEILESLTIEDRVTRDRFIKGRVENIKRMLAETKEEQP
jgi:hypothetical protein